MRYVLRVDLPDAPGSLHALTGACAAAGVDIVSLEVVERSGGRALDDLCITSDVDPDRLRRILDALPGTSVHSLRAVASFRDNDGAIALSAAIAAVGRGAVRLLVERLPRALWTGWAVAVARGWNGIEVLAASDDARTPTAGAWLPLVAARRLQASDLALDPPVDGSSGLELAAAPLAQPTSAIVVARQGGPRFVDRELRQLDLLARIAVATEVAHTERRPVEWIRPTGQVAVRT